MTTLNDSSTTVMSSTSLPETADVGNDSSSIISTTETASSSILPSSSLPSSSTTTLAALSSNVQLIGAMWMLSSAFFTTYSTTKFLKYEKQPPPTPPVSSATKTILPNTRPRLSSSSLRSLRIPTFGGSGIIRTKNLKNLVGTQIQRPQRQPLLSRSTLLTLYRFSGSLLLGILIGDGSSMTIEGIINRIQQLHDLCGQFIIPAIFLFIANYSNTISLNRIGISLTYVTKCAIPLCTVALTAILDGWNALPSLKVLSTLVPIAGGIATASWNHPTFELIGFVAAFTSCTAQAALNVTCKKTMSKLGVSGPTAQRCMVVIGLVIAIVYSTIQILSSTSSSSSSTSSNDDDDNAQPQQPQHQHHPPVWLTMAAVLAYHIEYMLSFIFVQLVAPVTYSACDAVRRLSIIVSGHYMFGGPPFTILNKAGIALALLGALAYSILNH